MATPLRVAECTVCAISSTNVEAPGSAQRNRTVVAERNVSAPWVTSRVTSYRWTSSRRARSSASARVRLLAATALCFPSVQAASKRSSSR